MDYIGFILGLATGVAVTLIITRIISGKKNTDINDWKQKKEGLERINATLTEEKITAETKLGATNDLMNGLKSKIADLENEAILLREQNTTFKSEKKHLDQSLLELKDTREHFKKEFGRIANDLLKSSTEDLTSMNHKRLGDILNPLKERLHDFEKKIADTHSKEMLVKGSLKEQLENLTQLNKQLTQQAEGLTKALKGDSKLQGDWGELMLERVLEQSGLVEGEHFEKQMSITNEDGSRERPDFVILLPEDKHIIIDSKVSLTAYERMINAKTAEDQHKFAKMHVRSVKTHIDELGQKGYHNNKKFNSPDFTLLFVPIEASFSTAIKEDTDLFNYAWKKRIVIVSPTTLLATLMTINSIWKQEKQTKNVLEIARQGGALYDKFQGFLGDLEVIDKSIQKTREAYDSAINKMSKGKGNLISRAEKIKKLGANTKKSIDDKWLEEETLPLNSHENDI